MMTSRVLAADTLIFLLLGCGGDRRAAINGTITFDGKPLPEGEITFHPDDRSAVVAAQVVGGAYQLRAPTGGARVEIIATRPGPQTAIGQTWVQYLPPQYNEKSDLRVEVKPATNQFDFDLKP